MKKLFSILLVILALFVSLSVHADTSTTVSNAVVSATSLMDKAGNLVDQVPGAVSNSVALVKEHATTAVHSQTATNLNQLMLEVLSGARDAGRDIYGASKSAIAASVDFVRENAEPTVKEFLRWRFCQALLWVFIGGMICWLLYYLGYRCHKAEPEMKYSSDKTCANVFGWVFKVAAGVVLIVFISGNVFEMVKIAVAPRVYIIEYVIDVTKDVTGNGTHRGRR